jgi:hypothetical protein
MSELKEAEVSSSSKETAVERVKAIVADNYNKHRDPNNSPAIEPLSIQVPWAERTRTGWNFIVVSHLLRGLLYEVRYNEQATAYTVFLSVYKRLNAVKIRRDIPADDPERDHVH